MLNYLDFAQTDGQMPGTSRDMAKYKDVDDDLSDPAESAEGIAIIFLTI